MKNWVSFSEKEYHQIWNKIHRDFKFKPSLTEFPSIIVPHPFVTYDISNYFNHTVDINALANLEVKALSAFKEITSFDEYMMALDWQHDCYWVNPHLEFDRDKNGDWAIPIFPDGDYYFFIQKEWKWGCLGHPWERSITVFGEELISAFHKHKPIMFHKILRMS